MSDRRIFVLLAHDAQTGCATTAVAVLGVAGDLHHVSWIPYQPDSEGWRQRLMATSAPMPDAVEAWHELADGVGWDLEEIGPAGSPDLHGDVEAALDELLAAAGEEA